MEDPEKLEKAENVIYGLTDEVIHILTEVDNTDYAAPRYMLPWLEEDAESDIRNLGLQAETEARYLQKINNLLGRYSDNQPLEIY
ncbi:MAG: hypothetical protein R6U19_04425 [Bacteroidales bacterium]